MIFKTKHVAKITKYSFSENQRMSVNNLEKVIYKNERRRKYGNIAANVGEAKTRCKYKLS